jgi:hypothetical protein
MTPQLALFFDDDEQETPAEEEVTEAIRISNLPSWEYAEEDLTPALKTTEGTWSLKPLQNKSLIACREARGGVLLLGCGVGKTLISLLLPSVMDSACTVLLVPAALREKTYAEIPAYREQFVFNTPHILSYEQLSRPSGLDYLKRTAPDLIICDEAHYVKSLDSTRTGRLGKYLMSNPACRLVVMSGTLFNKTLADFAHLADWSLEEGSPVPRNVRDVETFDNVLTGEANPYQYAAFKPLLSWGGKPREALYNRMNKTKGVVLTTEDTVGSSLRIYTRKPALPLELKDAIAKCFEDGVVDALEGLGIDFDLDEVSASSHLWEDIEQFALRALSQMLAGVLYYWLWENNEADTAWLEARRAWRRAVRIIRAMDLESYDSPQLIELGFNELRADIQDTFRDSFELWQREKHKPEPPRSAVWVSDYLIDDICAWVAQQSAGYIIWVDLIELGARLSSVLGIPYYAGGAEIPLDGRPCIMSVKSHGTGKNLQTWSVSLVAAAIADPATWEQLLARTHRTGQAKDEVSYTVYTHSVYGSALYAATRQAKVISETTGQAQRLTYADRIKD